MKKLKQILITLLLLLSFSVVHANTNVKADEIKAEAITLYDSLDYSLNENQVDYNSSVSYSDIAEATSYENFQKAVAPFRTAFINRESEFTLTLQTNLSRSTHTNDEVSALFTKISSLIYDELKTHTGKGNEGDYIWRNYKLIEPIKEKCRIDMNPKTNTWTFTYAYNIYYRTTKAQEDELTKELEKVYTELGLKTKNDYEKIRDIYKYITKNIRYDYTNLNDSSYELKFTAYAALINKTAVCQGYALLFYRMALDNNVDARYISGFGAGGPHGWNIVKLGNYYYNLDSTWDEGRTKYNYFLKNNANFTKHVRHDEFDTPEFNKKYPMSPTDYKEEVTIIKGDLNGDGRIELTDVLMLLKAYFNNTNQYSQVSDMNNDGKTDLTDVLMLLKIYFSNN